MKKKRNEGTERAGKGRSGGSAAVRRGIARKKAAPQAFGPACFCEKLPLPYQGLDADGRLTGVNHAWLEMLGYERPAVLGRGIGKFMTPVSAEQLLRLLGSAPKTGGFHAAEFEMVRSDGQRLMVVMDGMVERDGEGAVQKIHCVVVDRTGQRLAEEALQRSEQRYFTLFEHAAVPTWELDCTGIKAIIDAFRADGTAGLSGRCNGHPEAILRCLREIRVVNANRAGSDYAGIVSCGKISADLASHLSEGSWSTMRDTILALAGGETRYEAELAYTLPRSSERTILFRISIAPGSEATWSRVFLSFIDITEHRSLQHQLQSARQFTEDALNTIPDLFFALDASGRLLTWNRRVAEVTGFSSDEIGRMQPEQFFPPDHRPRVMAAIRRVLDAGAASVEADLLAKDGRTFAYEFTAGALRDPDGSIIGLSGIGRDIRDRRAFTNALGKFSRIVSATPDHIALLDRAYVYQLVNDSYVRAHGRPREKIIGLSVSELMGADVFVGTIKEKLDRCLAGETITYDAWYDFPATGRRYMSVTYYPYQEPDGSISGVVVSSRDISDKKQAEMFVADVLQSVDEGFLVIDANYRIVSANKAYCSQAGMRPEDIIGLHCYEVSHHLGHPCYEEGEDCAVRRTFESGHPDIALHTHLMADGTPNYVELKSFPLRDAFGRVSRVIEVIHDISEKRKLEEQLRHAQKMEAIGTLAGGVAHDFNNFLTVIMGYGNMLARGRGLDQTGAHYLDQILLSVDNAANLVRRLLTFGRKQVMEVKPADLNDIVRGLAKLLLRLGSEEVEQRLVLTSEPLFLMADRGQLEQVLMNLVSNARDAMPHGGSITISTQHSHLGPEFEHEHGFGREGGYAVLTVVDTGAGMDDRTRQRIFEPFFTTKEPGQGTGLGLAIVYGIVKQHGGYITAKSERGKGSVFRVYLPAIDKVREEQLPAEQHDPRCGVESVLVAEDDRNVRSLTCHILEMSGYRVIEAADGSEAVRRFAEHGDAVDLLLFDVLMPKKNGWTAYEEIREKRPGIKVIFLSGYSREVIGRTGISGEQHDYLQKPVAPKALLSKVREVLDRREGAPDRPTEQRPGAPLPERGTDR